MNPVDPAIATLDPTALVFVVICVVGAVLAVTLRNILHSILCLAVTLVGLAALFLYLGSPFVAAMEVVVYVGGISVAMIFAVMFSFALGVRRLSFRPRLLSALPPTAIFLVVGTLILRADFSSASPGRDWTLEAVGRALLAHYNLVFEALSVVLLMAIVGAIGIARKDPES